MPSPRRCCSCLAPPPSVITIDNMLAAQNAYGQMYQNAVFNQQQTNVVAMATTTRCVNRLLDPFADEVDEAILAGDAARTARDI